MQRENRRLAAIVAADIAGYSRLIGVDEEGTLRVLRAHRGELIDPLIDDHGGRIANTAGDSLLVEFPSAVDALRCAIAVQEGMTDRNRDVDADRQIHFRLGINIGDVIDDGGDLFGDGINVAARLEQIAEPGGIFVSGAVREQVAGKIDQDFDDLGHRKVKNIPHLVHVYRVHLVDLPAVEPSAFDISPSRERPLVTGGCMCGKTRFEISEPAIATIMCHCRMCQVFTSGPYAVWSTFPVEAIRWIEHEPKFFASSPIAVRGSCGKCGTSLTMRYMAPEPSDAMAILVSTFDHPDEHPPIRHACVESMMPWLDLNDSLPRFRSTDFQRLRERWASVGFPDPADWHLKNHY